MANRTKALEKALKFIQKGQYEKAIQEYLNILKDDPSDVRILTKVGDLYQKSGKKDEAIKYFIKAAEEYRKKGFDTKAAAAYKQALDLDPRRIDLHYKLAEFYANTGLIKDALRHYRNVVRLYELEGRLDKAADVLEKMVRLDPEDYSIKAKYVESLFTAGKEREAEVRIQPVVEGFKLHHRLEELAAFYEKLLNFRPRDVSILRDLAQIYFHIGNPKKGISKLKVIYDAGEFKPDDFILLSRGYQLLGKKEKAVQILKESLKEYRNDAKSKVKIAEKILEIDPQNDDAKKVLGIKEEEEKVELLVEDEVLGEEDEEGAFVAEVDTATGEMFGGTTTLDETQPQLSGLLRRADVFIENGLFDKAIESLERAVKLDPNNVDARAKLIDSYKKFKPGGAIPHLIALAEISESLGDIVSAREYFEEALRIDPNHSLVQKNIDKFSLVDKGEEELNMVVPGDDSDILAESELDMESVGVELEEEGISDSVEEDLSDAEFFANQGLVEEAISLYEKILKKHPELTDVRRKLKNLKKKIEEHSGTELTEAENPQRATGENAATRLNSSSEEIIESDEIIEDVEEIIEDQVDLKELIGDKLPEEETGGSKSDVPTMEEVLSAFKEGVKKELSDEDSAAHYDLGIAYKEMGLFDDAIEEFKTAARDPSRFVQSATMIGLCYRDNDQPLEAIRWFLKALKADGVSEDAYLELNYEIGRIYENKEDFKKAIYFYKNVLEKDKHYRDIIERIKSIKEKVMKAK